MEYVKIYLMDGEYIVAKTIKEAIDTYNEHIDSLGGCRPHIKHIELVSESAVINTRNKEGRSC